MLYNFSLFFKSFYKSFFRARGTHARLTRKRISFLVLFYIVWPLWGAIVWFTFLLDHVFFPGFRRQPIRKPLFILGNFRSGSTFLHRLIARDRSQFTSATTWDIFLSPSITLTKFFAAMRAIDRIFGSPLTKALKAFDQRTLGKVEIHRISFFKPEEDENFLLHMWSSSFAGMLFPFMEDYEKYFYFDQRVPERERESVMRFYRRRIQRFLYARRGTAHYLSKNPSFTPKIGSIIEKIPNARIVLLVREPLDMLLSTISWLGFTWRVFSDPLVKYPFTAEIIRFAKFWYEYPLKVLAEADPSTYIIIRFKDLVAHPEKTVRAIYEKFGYQLTAEFEEILKEENQKSREFRSSHRYSLEEMGLDKETVLREFAKVDKLYGLD